MAVAGDDCSVGRGREVVAELDIAAWSSSGKYGSSGTNVERSAGGGGLSALT